MAALNAGVGGTFAPPLYAQTAKSFTLIAHSVALGVPVTSALPCASVLYSSLAAVLTETMYSVCFMLPRLQT